MFDFATKILLPQLGRKPGKLYFIAGLKFDLFGVSDSNRGVRHVFGLPEGHWPNEKTKNTVILMFHHFIEKDMIDMIRDTLVVL